MNQEPGQESAVKPAVLRENCAAGVTKVTLNRPAQYNALSEDLLSALEDVLNDRHVDAVALFTPAPLHAEQSVAALRAGKHVLSAVPTRHTS